MVHALLLALNALVQWPNPALILVGGLVGTIAGMIPGLGGAVVVALMIPLTFSMTPIATMFLLLTAQGGVSQAGAVTGILVGMPGSSVNAATVLDGHELAKQGKAWRRDRGIRGCLGAWALSRCRRAGSVDSGAAAPPASARPAPVLHDDVHGPGDVIALVEEGSLLGNLISGTLGLLLDLIGYVTVSGGQQLAFGSSYLWDGLGLVPLFIGLFAVSGAVELLPCNTQVAWIEQSSASQLWEGVCAVFRNWGVLLQSSALGIVVGINTRCRRRGDERPRLWRRPPHFETSGIIWPRQHRRSDRTRGCE